MCTHDLSFLLFAISFDIITIATRNTMKLLTLSTLIAMGGATEHTLRGRQLGQGHGWGIRPPFTNPPSEDICAKTISTYTIQGSSDKISGSTGYPGGEAPIINDFCAHFLDETDPPSSWLATIDDYNSCLARPQAGPVIIGKWWFNRDIPNTAGSFAFEEDAVCGYINEVGSNKDGRVKHELWDENLLGKSLSKFEQVSFLTTLE